MRLVSLPSAAFVAVLALLVGGPLQSAQAATTVDVTYDLADSSLDFPVPISQLDRAFAGAMTVRYTSDGGLGIVPGPVTVLSLTFDAYLGFVYGYVASADFTGQLLSPVTGSLIGGNLAGLASFNLAVSGIKHCKYTGPCTASFGLVASIPFPLSGTTALSARLGGSIGPEGGAASTPHTVKGSLPVSLPIFTGEITVTSVDIVGRELQRTGGGQTKVVPEPGTLLLLGAGTAGLALVGRATRRGRRDG